MIAAIDSIRSAYVTDRMGENHFESKHRSRQCFMARTPNTEFCTIDTIDSIRSEYVTDRKGENHFESIMFHTKL
jgi:hypothetical protein